MPNPKKKQKLPEADANLVQITAASASDLSVDVLADIFGFLDGPKDIMQKRQVCKKWKEAVKKTIPPPADFVINGAVKYNAMNVMTEALPNLEQIDIRGFEQNQLNELFIMENGNLGYGHKFNDGEDPDRVLAAETANYATHDIEIISNFSKLRILKIGLTRTSFNGRYPVLFNFPLLEELIITYCPSLKWDLEMLAGLPSLKELYCPSNNLTGNISSLRMLKDSLQKVDLPGCHNVEGNFMDLADFPHLKKLDLDLTGVTGDIRDIGENDFSSLEYLSWMSCLKLPRKVYGGRGYQFQRISDGPDLIRLLYRLKKQRPVLLYYAWYGMLSGDSPDWYEGGLDGDDTPPFYICFVEAGCRVGYRWQTLGENPCEVNWLDPEPDREGSDYEKYNENLQEIERDVATSIYKGFRQPPTEEEYHRLFEEYAERHET